MNDILKFEEIEQLFLTLRGEKVILDCDVADLFEIGNRLVRDTVKKNPDKFPDGYMIHTKKKEKEELIRNFDRLCTLRYSTTCPLAFSMKGLCMLATLLKSEKAAQITLDMVDTFARIQDLAQIMKKISGINDNMDKKKLMKRSGGILTELFGNDMLQDGSESGIELNFTLLSFKHKVQIEEM